MRDRRRSGGGARLIRAKIASAPVLERRLKRARAAGKTVVFTNGCFDLLHAGHLKVFLECKRHGDLLVVGLNSDASVRRLKGPGRPIVPQSDRAFLIAGLAPVDFVTVFTEDTPERLIRRIRPDVIVKGGDWKAENIVGRDAAKRVVRVPLVKGRSTTNLVQRILDRYAR